MMRHCCRRVGPFIAGMLFLSIAASQASGAIAESQHADRIFPADGARAET